MLFLITISIKYTIVIPIKVIVIGFVKTDVNKFIIIFPIFTSLIYDINNIYVYIKKNRQKIKRCLKFTLSSSLKKLSLYSYHLDAFMGFIYIIDNSEVKIIVVSIFNNLLINIMQI
ncbi:hypothetical protein UT300013_05640 [Paraclostridium sordellii]